MIQEKNTKKILTFNVDNVIDIITNSSSELFVLDGQSKEIVQEMIENTYPEYLTEYEEVKSTDELSLDELYTYLQYTVVYAGYDSSGWISEKRIPEHFNMKPEDVFENWAEKGQVDENGKMKFWWGRLSESGAKTIKEKIGNKFFLFSIDENPNWDHQEDLMSIANRYHLG